MAARAEIDGPGEFEASTDVGQIERPGAAAFDAAKQQYRVTGSGANIWGSVDAFQFVWKKVSGDLELSAEINWQGDGKERPSQGGRDGAAGSRARFSLCRRGRAR